MSKATTIIKAGAKSQAVPAALIGLAGVALLGYLAGNKAENLLEGFTGSLGFGGTSEGVGAKTSDGKSIGDAIVSKYTDSLTAATKSIGDTVIDAGVGVVKTGAGIVVSTPKAIYQGASESIKIEPSTVQTKKTQAAITARTETGQAWSLEPASTEQLSKYVGTPGNVVSNWLEPSGLLSSSGDEFSEFTSSEKQRATSNPTKTTIVSRVTSLLSGDKAGSQKSYVQTGAPSETKYNVLSGSVASVAASYTSPTTSVSKTSDYGASTLGNLTSQVATLNNSSKNSTKNSTTKTYKESGQTKYKDASGKVHVKVK